MKVVCEPDGIDGGGLINIYDKIRFSPFVSQLSSSLLLIVSLILAERLRRRQPRRRPNFQVRIDLKLSELSLDDWRVAAIPPR